MGSRRRLSYLGTATIRQGERRTEATAALYTDDDAHDATFAGRYWGLCPNLRLQEGEAVIRFHDATEAKAVLTRVSPDSGTFRLDGHLRSLRHERWARRTADPS